MLASLTQELVTTGCPSAQKEAVSELLSKRCSHNLPGVGATPEWNELIDRIQLAVIRGSGWNVESIAKAIELANRDWRDVLMAAGFANDLESHRLWQRHALVTHDVS